MKFEWDPAKATRNRAKHGVGFREAMTVFADPLEITVQDVDHSGSETRFLSVGVTDGSRLAVVAYTERDGKIRIIHAREATPKERRAYESGKTSKS